MYDDRVGNYGRQTLFRQTLFRQTLFRQSAVRTTQYIFSMLRNVEIAEIIGENGGGRGVACIERTALLQHNCTAHDFRDLVQRLSKVTAYGHSNENVKNGVLLRNR